jgi:hypothetical protein
MGGEGLTSFIEVCGRAFCLASARAFTLASPHSYIIYVFFILIANHAVGSDASTKLFL